ncbi:6,7-dimethyl-8-ribityllumazine synthase [Compostibacter hankyongensis]|uniref:6,7-dimethyl-8-ribityllumazine synthase n=1 Tax=Compostibacter hankyongensis TaxID=1007089 RepID=A0ABP8FK56_9BACT
MSVHNDTFLNDAGIPDTGNASIVIVHTEWNAFIVDALKDGCVRTLEKYGVKKIRVLQVPGAFELPFACKKAYETSPAPRPDAIIALGCVIRGDTPHFDYVCQSVTDGVTRLNLTLPVPVIFGILTVDDAAQAEARVGGAHGHKGDEAALTALKMIRFNENV